MFCEKVFGGETLFISRPKNENVVMISEKEYNEMLKAKKNAEYLAMLDDGPCSGCRSTNHNGCSIEGCFLLECTKSHGIGFCGECDEFPCQKVHKFFEEAVYSQWLEGNQQIRDYGIDYFFEKNYKNPHYKSYKK